MSVRQIIMPLLIAALVPAVLAQTETLCGPDPSANRDTTLGDFARFMRKAPASHAKVALNDDDLKPRSPFPDIALDGEANDRQISEAYSFYAETHGRGEIDQTVRAWYEEQVATFESLRDEVAHIQYAQTAYYPSYYYSGQEYDADRAREQALLARAGQQADQRTMQRDNEQMQRMNSALARLRVVFDPLNTRYDWFVTNLNPYQR